MALSISALLLTWIAFAAWSFRKKWSATIAIGGGFCVAVAGMTPITYVLGFANWLREHSERFSFAVDQLKFLSFWIVADLVLFLVYPRFLAALWRIPIAGSICGYLIGAPMFHAAALVYGILIGFGATESVALTGGGAFFLIVTFNLAYWVAADNVSKGNIGMS